jgi:hypothetical protein
MTHGTTPSSPLALSWRRMVASPNILLLTIPAGTEACWRNSRTSRAPGSRVQRHEALHRVGQFHSRTAAGVRRLLERGGRSGQQVDGALAEEGVAEIEQDTSSPRQAVHRRGQAPFAGRGSNR